MKLLFKFQSILLLVLLFATSKTFAQTPDQVYIPKLGGIVNTSDVYAGSGSPVGSYGASSTGLADGSFATASTTLSGVTINSIIVNVFNKSGTQTNTQTVSLTSSSQYNNPVLVTLKSGDFVVAYWDNQTCKIQKFTAAGALSGTAVSVYTTSFALSSGVVLHRIVALDNGGMAILVTYDYGGDPLTSGLVVKQYNASMTQVGTTYTSNLSFLGTTNSAAPGTGYFSKLFKLANDNYVVALANSGYGTNVNNAAVLQFDTNNSLVGTIKNFGARQGSVAGTGLANGGYVVAYYAQTPVTNKPRVFFQLYDATGTAIGTPQTVTDPSATYVNTAEMQGHVIARSDGGFQLLQAAYDATNVTEVFIRTYTSTGSEITTANKYKIVSFWGNPGAIALPNGGYVYGYMTADNTAPYARYAKVVQLDANLNLVNTITNIAFPSSLGTTTHNTLTPPYYGAPKAESIIYNYGNGFAVPIAGVNNNQTYYGVQRFGATSCLTAPTLSGTTAANTCPTTTANLSSLVTSTAPSGSTIKWFDNATTSGTAIADPTAVATAGTYYAYYYNATDNCYTPASAGVTVTITACTPPLTASTPTAQTATTNQAKTGNAATELAPTGGTSPYTYSNGSGDAACVAPSGATALTGLTVNANGSYSYTAPATAGTYYYCIKVCDSATPTASCVVKVYTLTVTAACNAGAAAPLLIKN